SFHNPRGIFGNRIDRDVIEGTARHRQRVGAVDNRLWIPRRRQRWPGGNDLVVMSPSFGRDPSGLSSGGLTWGLAIASRTSRYVAAMAWPARRSLTPGAPPVGRTGDAPS